MRSYAAALFTGGPVAHLLDLAIRAQASKGTLPLDDEIRRYGRLAATSQTASHHCPVRTAAALLDALVDLPEHSAVDGAPQEFREKLSSAAEDTDPAGTPCGSTRDPYRQRGGRPAWARARRRDGGAVGTLEGAVLVYARSVSSSANTWDSGCGPTYCWQLHWPDS
ncbi:hypothetical protein [Streptomyces sp. NPDC059994]|uniref:hypothetical protein n=1 Tax=Streptomyces sp. NPDC059994 TaxID=3347029 RepID=UPI00367BB9D4